MAKRMNWNKARPGRETEFKYDEGTVLSDGRVIRKQADGLAARAQKAERDWLRANRMTSIFAKPPKKRKPQKKKPFFDRSKLFDDVVITTLEQLDKEGGRRG